MPGQPVFNLNFDDIHPESSTEGSDCGGDREKGVFGYFKRIWKKYPYVKITLFVTPNWIDRSNIRFPMYYVNRLLGKKYTREWGMDTFRLDKYKDWCDWLNSFENFELAAHGLYHHRETDPHGAEFLGMSRDECLSRLKTAEEIFSRSGLRVSRGFRPPGWGISDGLFEALRELDYEFIACSGDMNVPITQDAVVKETGIKNVPLLYPSKHCGMVNIPQNWDIKKSDIKRALEIAKLDGLVSAKGHIAGIYDGEVIQNGLNDESFENIMALLEELENFNIRYLTMHEIAQEFKK